MERLFTDIYGNELKKNERNIHHPFYRSTAKGAGCAVRKFIEVVKVPMVKETHQALHRETTAPHMPSVSLIHRINGHINSLDGNNPYERLISVTEFLEDLADNCPNSDHRKQSGRIVENLHTQLPFILEGQVLIVPQEQPMNVYSS